MDSVRAKQILQALVDGMNPVTGAVLPRGDSCNQPEVMRALIWVLQEIEKIEQTENASAGSGGNADRNWTDEDERMLFALL